MTVPYHYIKIPSQHMRKSHAHIIKRFALLNTEPPYFLQSAKTQPRTSPNFQNIAKKRAENELRLPERCFSRVCYFPAAPAYLAVPATQTASMARRARAQRAEKGGAAITVRKRREEKRKPNASPLRSGSRFHRAPQHQ